MLAAMAVTSGCRPVPPAGLPREPSQALHALGDVDLPDRFSLSGRLRVAIAGVDLDLGLQLQVVGTAARLDIDLPFGGRAMSVVLGTDGTVLCTTIQSDATYYSNSADDLARVLLGEWADASALVAVITGRLPASFDGEVTWQRRGKRSMLALSLPAGRTALCDAHRRPPRLRELLLLEADESLQGHATWDGWHEVDDYWFPGEVKLSASRRVGNLHVIIRHVDLDPTVATDAFDTTPPVEGYSPFDELLKGRTES